MKKNLLLIVLLLMSLISSTSCSKDEDPDKDTTVTFIYSMDNVENVIVDAIIFEYNSKDEVVGSLSVKNCKKGTSKIFSAKPTTEKIKVQLNIGIGILEKGYWVQEVYYINTGQDNHIEISGSTITGSKEP